MLCAIAPRGRRPDVQSLSRAGHVAALVRGERRLISAAGCSIYPLGVRMIASSGEVRIMSFPPRPTPHAEAGI
jgi:hypothetical protein